ncbi:isopenicillin N synthase family dioxygenase [Noviherbaspirillum pedocola]|uniref:2-oxoglutarate-dependent ethylene/succinate-forming enzyme n=1 Tax=Noviherbaspirillum pedocola TaxID=2801341 RepID=A0A934SRE9_9BURK|nr:isopenicillin N synthase family oxygenase [Noviherbaspirillum pedocola]MBK4735376.1 isopenicillin N synthase family oxygenase [Noviherbaspirillum pedocola]
MKLLQVPVIDISAFSAGTAEEKQHIARQVDQACRDIGFLVISGHGVSPERIADMRRVSRAFFDLPHAEKARVARPAPDVTRGYIGMEEESVGRLRDANAKAGDLNESLMIGPVDLPPAAYAFAPEAGKHFAPNLWPEQPAELREVWSAYYREMGKLAQTLMRIFALGLGLEETFFDDKIDRHISRLRVRNYPAQIAQPVPGQIRAGAHSDYGSLTILAAEDRPGGLQVCNAEGVWVDVPIVPDCYIINIGDLMARWTNDTWVSTLHRVVNPPAGSGEDSRRQSLVFFHNPNYDAEISCIPTCRAEGEVPRYQPITSGEYLRNAFVTTQN